MKADVAIVIVSYNSAEFIGACLESVISGRKEVRQQIIVVDNDSRDDTVELIRERFPGSGADRSRATIWVSPPA